LDFTAPMLKQLDREAEALNIIRKPAIKKSQRSMSNS